MPYAFTNGVRLAYERHGQGERVLFIMGSGAGGRVWTLHQVPAIVAAGYQAITFDNRGIPPSDAPEGRYSLNDMVTDTCGLIESLDAAPCRIVGVSLGAIIAQELAILRPDLVRCAVLIATKSRSDVVRQTHIQAAQAAAEKGQTVPPELEAVNMALQMLSPATLNDDREASLWLETFRLFARPAGFGHGQLWASNMPDRRQELASISAHCRVIAFSDDLVTPPHLGREVAEAIPCCDYVELNGCGHYGYLEQPDQVNTAIIEFIEKN